MKTKGIKHYWLAPFLSTAVAGRLPSWASRAVARHAASCWVCCPRFESRLRTRATLLAVAAERGLLNEHGRIGPRDGLGLIRACIVGVWRWLLQASVPPWVAAAPTVAMGAAVLAIRLQASPAVPAVSLLEVAKSAPDVGPDEAVQQVREAADAFSIAMQDVDVAQARGENWRLPELEKRIVELRGKAARLATEKAVLLAFNPSLDESKAAITFQQFRVDLVASCAAMSQGDSACQGSGERG